jgi:hypothetical protein
MRAQVAPADRFDFDVAAGRGQSGGSSAAKVGCGLLAVASVPVAVGFVTFVAAYSNPVSSVWRFLVLLAIVGVALPVGLGLAALRAEPSWKSPLLRVSAGLVLIAVASFQIYQASDSSYWHSVFPSGGQAFSRDVAAEVIVTGGIPALIGLVLLGWSVADFVRARRGV